MLVYKDTDSLIQEILANNYFQLINMNEDLKVLETVKKSDFYAFLIYDIEDFQTFLSKSYRTFGWNAHANILVVYLGFQNVNNIFQVAWEYSSINVTVLTQFEELYTYFPITESNCAQVIQKSLLGNCSTYQKKPFEIFPRKLFKQFHRCSVRVIPMDLEPYVLDVTRKKNPGYEIMLLREIAHRLNLTLAYVSHDKKQWGTKLADGTYTDIFELLYNRAGDLMVGMVMANISIYEDFEHTYPHSEDFLGFWIPTPLLVEGWKNFILIFDSSMWFATIGSIFFASIVWWLIGLTRNDPEGYDNISNCVMKVWCVLFSFFNIQPRSWLIRAMFLMWSLYCFLLSQTYQSVLISFLTRPAYETEIATIKQLAYSQITPGGLYITREFLYEPGNEVLTRLYDRFVFCPLQLTCMNQSASQRNLAIIKNYKQVKYLISLIYTYPNGYPKVRISKDILVSTMLFLQTIKGFVYLERFNEVIFRLRESGLSKKWEEDAVRTWQRAIPESYKVIPLTMSHLKATFWVLLFGLGVGVAGLMGEVFWFRRGALLKEKLVRKLRAR